MGLCNRWDMVKDTKRKEQIDVALNNKSLIRKIVERVFQSVCPIL